MEPAGARAGDGHRLPLAAAVRSASRADGLDQLTSVVTGGALSAFVLLHASVVGWYAVRRRSPSWLPHLVPPTIGTAVIV